LKNLLQGSEITLNISELADTFYNNFNVRSLRSLKAQ